MLIPHSFNFTIVLHFWMTHSVGFYGVLFSSNRSIVIAADDSLVSWGPSPTYGELVRS